MIGTVVRISWLNLSRDRVALALTFVLPLVFFSVFARVFGGLDEGARQPISVALLAEEVTPIVARLEELVAGSSSVRLLRFPEVGGAVDRLSLPRLLRSGKADVAVVIPSGFSAALAARGREPPEVVLYANEAHPMAAPLVEGLLQSAALAMAIEAMTPAMFGTERRSAPRGLIRIRTERALAMEGRKPSVAFFAAGIGVMFLLFSVSGRSAILIEERETGVLTRLLASQLTLDQLLLGRWLFLAALGFFQVGVMFVWASAAFGLDLWTPRHLSGFACMTAASAAAAAGLGVLLAVSCRSRAQLNGIASVLILVMSALGGSMFPRFLMPEDMQRLGRLTFNAWALDGYQKVFWYDATPGELRIEMSVLCLACVVFLLLARYVARRSVRA